MEVYVIALLCLAHALTMSEFYCQNNGRCVDSKIRGKVGKTKGGKEMIKQKREAFAAEDNPRLGCMGVFSKSSIE